MVPMAGGINPLGFVIDGAEDGSGLEVRSAALRQELQAWQGEWEVPVRVGWRPGFRDTLRKQFEADLADLLDQGQVLLSRDVEEYRDLAFGPRGDPMLAAELLIPVSWRQKARLGGTFDDRLGVWIVDADYDERTGLDLVPGPDARVEETIL
jgi:hypothetical protein